MKKALSVLLAIMMLFGALAVGASAEQSSIAPTPWHEVGAATAEQAILGFDLNGGTMKNPVLVYNLQGEKKWTWEENFQGTYYMVPQDASSQKAGRYVTLPAVTAPAGYQFDGWYCYKDGLTYGVNGSYMIKDADRATLISFRAAYSPAEIKDSSSNAMNILTKVFGTIIGIFFKNGDIDAGIALVQKMLGAIFS